MKAVKYAPLLALLFAACDLSEDVATDRPLTLSYVSSAILAPNCASAECHSSFKFEKQLAFDTVDATTRSLNRWHDVVTCEQLVPAQSSPCDDVVPTDSTLFSVLVTGVDEDPKKLMPYDQSMSNADIELIGQWIKAGAPGYTYDSSYQ